MKTIPMQANLPHLLKMSAQEIKNPGISIGFAVSLSYLEAITKKALEIDDEYILACLYHIGMIECDDDKEIEKMRELISKDNKEGE